MTVYTLKKKKDTEEFHLFEGEMTGPNTCNTGSKSICKKMDRSESESIKFGCWDEKKARTGCADAGRAACGTCVSHLYTTY